MYAFGISAFSGNKTSAMLATEDTSLLRMHSSLSITILELITGTTLLYKTAVAFHLSRCGDCSIRLYQPCVFIFHIFMNTYPNISYCAGIVVGAFSYT